MEASSRIHPPSDAAAPSFSHPWWPRPWLLLAISTWLLFSLFSHVRMMPYTMQGLIMLSGAIFFTCIFSRRIALTRNAQSQYSPFSFCMLCGMGIMFGGLKISIVKIDLPPAWWMVVIGGALTLYGVFLFYIRCIRNRKIDLVQGEAENRGAWTILAYIYYVVFCYSLANREFSPLAFIFLVVGLILSAEAGILFAHAPRQASADSCGIALMFVAVISAQCPVVETQPLAILNPWFPVVVFVAGAILVALHYAFLAKAGAGGGAPFGESGSGVKKVKIGTKKACSGVPV